ncbi:uncharacterized protein [Spinacia oleracea]|uniref:Uncharacterized protein n=1 Tax=Spinacia oleracea TaxID=3562 RepID=A0ABM3QQQ4_SPIOL|nr:uncharacterized protein LOC130461560 [Spinacia oleracea]
MTGVRNQYERRSKHKHDKQATNPVDTEERNKNERAKETEPVVPQSLLNDIMNNLEDPEHHTNQETEVNTNEKSNDNGNQEQESDLTQGRKETVRDPEDHTNQETEVNTNEKSNDNGNQEQESNLTKGRKETVRFKTKHNLSNRKQVD